MRVFVLGASGLLGSHIESESKRRNLTTVNISRKTVANLELQLQSPNRFASELGAKRDDYIINALGVTRHRIVQKVRGADSVSVKNINSLLPAALGVLNERVGTRVIQPGTDCVFSGEKGNYSENDSCDATDLYGMSKALGESVPGIHVLRASYVGPSGGSGPQLWDWVKNQRPESTINGFSNVFWNGVTARVLAKLFVAVIENRFPLPGTQHLVPSNQVSKDQLVRLIAKKEGRHDLRIKSKQVVPEKNHTLSTGYNAVNEELWKLISFEQPPTIEELILGDSSSM